MKKLTRREEEVMRHYWRIGAMFVRELMECYVEPKPHFNTLSTMSRTLEAKGYLAHNVLGNSHQYYPVISEEEFGESTIDRAVNRYMGNSYLSAVSALVKQEKISIEELKELIKQIEQS